MLPNSNLHLEKGNLVRVGREREREKRAKRRRKEELQYVECEIEETVAGSNSLETQIH